MKKKTAAIVRQKFMEFRNYREQRLNQPFHITAEEWEQFFLDPQRAIAIAEQRAVGKLRRINATEPWTIDNLAFGEVQPRTYRRSGISAFQDTEAKLAEGFNRIAVEEAADEIKLLTPAQWISELRAAQNASTHK